MGRGASDHALHGDGADHLRPGGLDRRGDGVGRHAPCRRRPFPDGRHGDGCRRRADRHIFGRRRDVPLATLDVRDAHPDPQGWGERLAAYGVQRTVGGGASGGSVPGLHEPRRGDDSGWAEGNRRGGVHGVSEPCARGCPDACRLVRAFVRGCRHQSPLVGHGALCGRDECEAGGAALRPAGDPGGCDPDSGGDLPGLHELRLSDDSR